MSQYVQIQLSCPTALADLNKKEGFDAHHERTFINVARMRYGHIKAMQAIAPEQQTAWAIKQLTGLSDQDMDQLYAEDAAEITKTIFGFVEKYFTLAKQMWNSPGAIS